MSDINLNSFYEKVDFVGNDKALAQSMLIVFATKKRTRPGRPNFGCFVHKFLFDPLDSDTASLISLDLGDAIEDEANGLNTRVLDFKVTVRADKSSGTFWVKILYKSIYNDKESLTFNLSRSA